MATIFNMSKIRWIAEIKQLSIFWNFRLRPSELLTTRNRSLSIFPSQVSTDSGERNSEQNLPAVPYLKRTHRTTVYYRCRHGDCRADFGGTCGRKCNWNFRTGDWAMCLWKHIEILDTWNWWKTMAKLMLKAAVQLTAAQICLTATHTEIQFTYCFMILFNSNFCSVSGSIIWSASVRFNQIDVPICTYTHITRTADLICCS